MPGYREEPNRDKMTSTTALFKPPPPSPPLLVFGDERPRASPPVVLELLPASSGASYASTAAPAPSSRCRCFVSRGGSVHRGCHHVHVATAWGAPLHAGRAMHVHGPSPPVSARAAATLTLSLRMAAFESGWRSTGADEPNAHRGRGRTVRAGHVRAAPVRAAPVRAAAARAAAARAAPAPVRAAHSRAAPVRAAGTVTTLCVSGFRREVAGVDEA